MGFDIERRTARLQFVDGSLLAGAEVVVSLDLPIREFIALQREFSKVSEDTEGLAEVLQAFGDKVLRSWNLRMDGEDLPATGEGMVALPLPHALEITTAWSNVIAGRDPNSASASTSSGNSEAPPEVTEAA